VQPQRVQRLEDLLADHPIGCCPSMVRIGALPSSHESTARLLAVGLEPREDRGFLVVVALDERPAARIADSRRAAVGCSRGGRSSRRSGRSPRGHRATSALSSTTSEITASIFRP
jgi:hypothetical protein